jgi:hypothetical protein
MWPVFTLPCGVVRAAYSQRRAGTSVSALNVEPLTLSPSESPTAMFPLLRR